MTDEVITALNRVEGQVRGIKKMYETGRECEQVSQQIAAAVQALKNIGTKILTKEAVRCSKQQDNKELVKTINNLVKMS